MVSSSSGNIIILYCVIIRTNFLSEINVGSNPALTTKFKKDLVINKNFLIFVKQKKFFEIVSSVLVLLIKLYRTTIIA